MSASDEVGLANSMAWTDVSRVGHRLFGSASPSSEPRRAGAIQECEVEVAISDQRLPTSKSVDCTFIQSMTTVKTGDDDTGATVVIDNAGGLEATSVTTRRVGGFTGGYSENLGDHPAVKMSGRTYSVSRTANGFDAHDPGRRTAERFSNKASC